MALFWHRRDLRIADDVGLHATTDDALVTPVFVLDPDVLEYASAPRTAFLLDALRSLREAYRGLGSDLLIREGDPRTVLPELASERGSVVVSCNRDYSGLATQRDREVKRRLSEVGVSSRVHDDALLHEPGSITTNEGGTYSVYSYFWQKWRDREKEAPVDPPGPSDLAEVSGDPVPAPEDVGFDAPDTDLPTASTAAARDRLASFRDGPIFAYADRRDYPAAEATSRLSPHLTFGTIGIREVYAATTDAMERAEGKEERESVSEYRSQLAWREFYAHVLRDRPETVRENYREYEREIEWRDDPDELRAWQAGETGYPIVDAGMRQLREEAWMHNRVRMIVASFLTKDLLIHWRRGYEHFRERLLDHDTANDVGGWQWAASTGTDAQPYFRIFNPMTQGERYDPDAEYIREYVPELRGAPPEAIHAWHELDDEERSMHAPDYHAPIVDHARRRERALATFEAARGE